MKNLTKRDFVAGIFALLFTGSMFWLLRLRHDAFNSLVGDFARFSQAIWSVLDGQLLYTHIPGRSILGDHFSPIMVTAAPFLLVWPDERMLLLLQASFVAITGLILYLLMRSDYPKIAPIVLLAYYLNPEVHEFVLGDFRRIGFALPWLALATVGLVQKRRGLLLAGLLIALLAKESVALYIASVGLYLLIFERDWRWGLGLIGFGSVALIVISDLIIPAFSGAVAYPQLFYYSQWGDSYGSVVAAILSEPMRFIETVFGPVQRAAFSRILLPFGLLILLDAKIALITLPYILLMFLSNDPDMVRLEDWYAATVLPFWFAALIASWRKIGPRWQQSAAAWLLVCTVAATLLFSPSPLGRRYQPQLYAVDDHDRAGNLIAQRVPEEISLLAHTRYATHLTHVNEIEVFLLEHEGVPFSAEAIANHSHLLIDRNQPQPPLGLLETELIAQNLLADPSFTILEENDGIYYMQRTPAAPAIETAILYEEQMLLNGISLAITDDQGFFVAADPSQLNLMRGQTMRVDLFWESLGDVLGERTVSVRLSSSDGTLIAQQDHQPAEGIRPTSWWKTGQQVRDIHYLDIPLDAVAQPLSLDLVVYDSFTQEIVPTASAQQVQPLASILLNLERAD